MITGRLMTWTITCDTHLVESTAKITRDAKIQITIEGSATSTLYVTSMSYARKAVMSRRERERTNATQDTRNGNNGNLKYLCTREGDGQTETKHKNPLHT
jgi:hypothetical protein